MANRFREKPVEERPTQRQKQAPEPEEQPTPPTTEKEEEQKPEIGKVGRTVARLLGGEILADKAVLKQWKLVLMVLVCFLVVVTNRYNVEKISRDRDETRNNIKYLREHRVQMQKRYQQGVKISQIAEDLKESGVGITAGPPYEIESINN